MEHASAMMVGLVMDAKHQNVQIAAAIRMGHVQQTCHAVACHLSMVSLLLNFWTEIVTVVSSILEKPNSSVMSFSVCVLSSV
jgi:hypothetical protein